MLFRTRTVFSNLEKFMKFRSNLYQYEILQCNRSASNSGAAQPGPTEPSPVQNHSVQEQVTPELNEKREPFVKNLFKGKFDDVSMDM